MDYDEIRSNVSKNLVTLRKTHGLTQAQFGEMFAFSDKTISKWESGASIPDVATLVQIASKFNVSLDELVKNEPLQEEEPTSKVKFRFSVFQRVMILVLTIALGWALSGLAYIFVQEVFHKNLWPVFLWAIPFSSVCVGYANIKYFKNIFIKIATESVTIWSVLIACYYSFMKFNITFMPIFFLGIPLEIIAILNAMVIFWKEKENTPKKDEKVQNEIKNDESNTKNDKDEQSENIEIGKNKNTSIEKEV